VSSARVSAVLLGRVWLIIDQPDPAAAKFPLQQPEKIFRTLSHNSVFSPMHEILNVDNSQHTHNTVKCGRSRHSDYILQLSSKDLLV
jgi:hypothetical protein